MEPDAVIRLLPLVTAQAGIHDVSSPSLSLPVCMLQGGLPFTSSVGRAQTPAVCCLAHARLIIHTTAMTLNNKAMKTSHRAMVIRTTQPGITPRSAAGTMGKGLSSNSLGFVPRQM